MGSFPETHKMIQSLLVQKLNNFLSHRKFCRIHLAGSARVFGYTVYRGFLNRVYGILQLKYGYSVYHFL